MTLSQITLVLTICALASALLALLRATRARQETDALANDLRRQLANQEQRGQEVLKFLERALARLASGKPMTRAMLQEQRLWEDLDGKQAAQRVAEGALPIDVRTDSETQSGMLPNALHIPLDSLESRIGELPRHKPLLIYCAAGARSADACEFLCQEGFEEVSNLASGFSSWPHPAPPTP